MGAKKSTNKTCPMGWRCGDVRSCLDVPSRLRRIGTAWSSLLVTLTAVEPQRWYGLSLSLWLPTPLSGRPLSTLAARRGHDAEQKLCVDPYNPRRERALDGTTDNYASV